MHRKKACVGGSAFIGSYVLSRLVERGEKAISYSRSPPPEGIIDKVIVEKGDIRYLVYIIGAIKKHDVEHTIHIVSMLTIALQTNAVLAFDINARALRSCLTLLNVLRARRYLSFLSANRLS